MPRRSIALAAVGVGLIGVTGLNGASAAAAHPVVKHVLLLSVDGLHQSDLSWYVLTHAGSRLASLVHRGTDFVNARTQTPSDSPPPRSCPPPTA